MSVLRVLFSRTALKSSLATGLALTVTGCVDLGALKGDLKGQVDATSVKTAELQRAVNDLSSQVRTLNEENNSVKSLVSKVSDSVLAQQNKIEELEGKLSALQSAPRSAAPSGERKSKRR